MNNHTYMLPELYLFLWKYAANICEMRILIFELEIRLVISERSLWGCMENMRQKDLLVSRGTAGFRKRNMHCILGAGTRGNEKKGGREGRSLKAWASRNSDVAFGLETTASGSCSLGSHGRPVCYHMGFAVTTKYLKPHRAVRIAFLDSLSFFVSENVASLRRPVWLGRFSRSHPRLSKYIHFSIEFLLYLM